MSRVVARHAAGAGIWRARATLAGVVAVCIAVTIAAVSGASSGATGQSFIQSGHWIYNSTLGTVFHVHGETRQVDEQINISTAGPSARVVQTDNSGYVLADGSITEFGKSDLQVADPLPAPSTEQPVGLEAAGVAYAIYRHAGKILRLGANPVVVSADGQLGQPVVTSTGTLWVHGLATGQVCQLSLGADRLSCTARTPSGHTGALTLVGDQLAFVDTTAKEMRAVGNDGFGRVVTLTDLDITPASLVAPNDVAGRVAILEPRTGVLQLVDAAGLTSAKSPGRPVVKQLKPGRYEQIASSGNGLALINASDDTLVTLDRDGEEQSSRKIPAPSRKAKAAAGERPALSRGADSRLYVDSVAGEHTMVVEDNGEVTEVATAAPAKKPEQKPRSKPESKATPPPVTPSEPVHPPQSPATQKPAEPPVTSEPVEPAATRKPAEPPKTIDTPDPAHKERKPSVPPRSTTTPPPKATPRPDPKPTVKASKPGAPGGVSASASDATATVNWSPAAANGAAITSYLVSWAGGSRTVTGSSRRATVTGLINGQSYAFTVRAANRVGTGAGVSTKRITPLAPSGPADAPGGLQATASSGAVTLSWRRPNLNGGTFLRYVIVQGDNSKDTSGTSYRWSGLTNGKRYTFQVFAVTLQGAAVQFGKAATVSATPGANGGGGGGSGTITASRGPAYTDDPDVCQPSKCFYIHIRARNLLPNTTYTFQGHTTNYGDLHDGGGDPLRTDANGNLTVDKFYNDDVGGRVWVTADGPAHLESNRVTW